ncbi:MAG: helix-turn-helix transcriptional regulator [Erythrobacter sp.]
MQEITAEQIKAARAALGWTIKQVAEEAGIGSATLKRYEATSGIPKSRKGHLGRLREHFEASGIEFIGSPDDRPGIRIGKQ